MLALFLCCTSALAQTESVFRGYLKNDVKIFEGSDILRRGTEVECTWNRDNKECCYEEEPGTVCIVASELSQKKVPKRDIAIESITYNDSTSAEKDACVKGTDYRVQRDAFKWSYGVRLKNNTDGRAMIYITHIARRGALKLPLPAMTKMWIGPIDNKCHAFNFTKKDISEFLNSYLRSLGPYLDPALDLNLNVEVVIQVFSEFPEDNYKNNEVKFDALLPINSESDWPPVKFR
jgi:hypothetical protein